MNNDMTTGNLLKKLIIFSIPLILSGILQQLFNWADAFIVGNIDGELSLAAIGASGTLTGFIILALVGFTAGLSILVAKKFGDKKFEDITDLLSTFFIVIMLFLIIASSLTVFIIDDILFLLNTPADIFELSKSYVTWFMVGIPFTGLYNIYSCVLIGLGDSKVSFLAIMISSIVNVLLDILFVGTFKMGVAGAAIATSIAQIIMSLFTVTYALKKYRFLRFSVKTARINKSAFKQGLSYGAPLLIQSTVKSAGGLFLQNFMNGFGPATIAAITTAYRVDNIAMLPVINLGVAISTSVAQNTGANETKRASKSVLYGITIIAIVSIALTFLVLNMGGAIISIFGISETSVEIGDEFFRVLGPFYIVFGMSIAVKAYLEGIGQVSFTSIASIISLIARIFLSYMIADFFGNMSIALAEGISYVIMLILCLIQIAITYKKLKVKK